jgi:hypothetical protein
MSGFEERGRNEEQAYRHSEELRFKTRNRRNRLFGQWIAETYLGLKGEAASSYAKDVVMADFETPGDQDMLNKVRTDLTRAGQALSDHLLTKHLAEFEHVARQQVMSE